MIMTNSTLIEAIRDERFCSFICRRDSHIRLLFPFDFFFIVQNDVKYN